MKLNMLLHMVAASASGVLSNTDENWIDEIEGAVGSHSVDDLFSDGAANAADAGMDVFQTEVVEETTGFLGSVLDKIPSMSDISDAVGDALGTVLSNTVGRVLYMIVSGINWFFSIIYQFFEVFSGQMKVSYRGEFSYLTNIFFENSTISGIYWGMALIGVALCFAFTIIAIIRKMFDGSDKVQVSMGAILGSMFKSILLILSLNVAMVVVLNFTNVLMQRVIYVFNAGSSLTESQRIDFTEDQYATMGRVLNTIGNYSLNPSYNSRYNLNSCFNEIRGDMLYLQEQGVFDFYYITKDAEGNEIETWQSALQPLVFTASLKEELKMDVYYEGVSHTLLEIMDTLRENTAFYPLEYYERTPAPLNNIPMDRVLFLACTYNAALNEEFNINPSHTDALRGPYYSGQKSIYDFSQVAEDFNLIWGFNYIVFFLIIYGIWKEMMYILMDCIARIYNMVLLYVVAPPFIALSPLDNGGKMKQWTTAFIVQCFGVFGTVVAMRLLLTFMPIIVSTDLEIFHNPAMDIIAKVFLINGGCLAARKASAMFTGILADSAGWQSITAGNLRSDYDEQQRKRESASQQKDQEKKQKKDMETAKSAAKVSAGGGDMNDAKNLGKAAKEQKDGAKEKAGVGGVDTPGENKTPGGDSEKSDGGGQDTGKQDAGGKDTGDNTGGGQDTGKQDAGGKDTGDNTGGNNIGGNAGQEKQTAAGGEAGPNVNFNIEQPDGFMGIPVAPDIAGTRHFDQGGNQQGAPQRVEPQGQGQGQGGNEEPPKQPPPLNNQ